MGDNATKRWEWHNNVVGEGYQARGVIRQPGRNERRDLQIVDMSKPEELSAKNSDNVLLDSPKEKGRKSSKKKRRRDTDYSCDDDVVMTSRFNPLLQLLAKRLSNKTMEFC